jgi:hypothetical protein
MRIPLTIAHQPAIDQTLLDGHHVRQRSDSADRHDSGPGKPSDNAIVESFDGWLRGLCLNTNWFLFLDDARCKIEAWR